MRSELMEDLLTPVAPEESIPAPRAPKERRPRKLRAYEAAVSFPLIAWLVAEALRNPNDYASPSLLLWAVGIAIVDLMPLPLTANMHFSVSFPLQLAVALLYPPYVAGAVALIGTSDPREFRLDLPPLKALFIRSQIAVSVVAEATVFHSIASVHSDWKMLALGVVIATAVGYCVNVLLVAGYSSISRGVPPHRVVAEMHEGILGELVLSYMGLALFGVVIAVFFVQAGVWSMLVFIAPLAFARQMFARTHSLKQATDELAARERENEYLALHDSLTGLPNRALFMRELRAAVEATDPDKGVAVMLMDLDQFKEVNDSLGHHFGDLLLQEIPPRLQRVVREGDTVARLGGDEFGVVLPGVSDAERAIEVANRILDELQTPVILEDLPIDTSASIGIALHPEHSGDIDTLLRCADIAMYSAKRAHTGFEVYSPENDEHSPQRVALLGQIRPAMERGQIDLWFQPQLSLTTGEVRAAEALLRWQHPEQGLVMPSSFLPFAERTTLLRPLTLHIINRALSGAHEWIRAGYDINVAVNLSPHSLLDLDLPEQIAALLRRWEVPPTKLQFELTEDSLMADSQRSIEVFRRLSAVGVGLSIDDFGTGYSSLSHLRRLPVDEIKVDRSFVLNMMKDPNDESIVRATIDLAHNLSLRVVAEGVEDIETWDCLRRLRCDFAQGYLMCRPAPLGDFMDWLDRRANAAAEPLSPGAALAGAASILGAPTGLAAGASDPRSEI
jgi:diguanylate cyclase (GGDEF)-like protein